MELRFVVPKIENVGRSQRSPIVNLCTGVIFSYCSAQNEMMNSGSVPLSAECYLISGLFPNRMRVLCPFRESLYGKEVGKQYLD